MSSTHGYIILQQELLSERRYYFHEKTIVFSDGNFADFAEILDLNVLNLVHICLVSKHLA